MLWLDLWEKCRADLLLSQPSENIIFYIYKECINLDHLIGIVAARLDQEVLKYWLSRL